MAVYVGDIPAVPFAIEPPDTIDLSDYDTVTATLVNPTGVLEPEVEAEIVGTAIEVTFPDDVSLFDIAGVYLLNLFLDGIAGRTSLPPLPIVAQPVFSRGWHTLDSVRSEWPDAEQFGDMELWELLQVARQAVEAFAPMLPAPDIPTAPIPDNYRVAQRMQARNVWNSTKVAPDGTTGIDDFVIRPFPLDWQIKQLLRPKRGTPVIG